MPPQTEPADLSARAPRARTLRHAARAVVAIAAACALVVALPSCGGDDIERAGERVDRGLEAARREFEQARERLGQRIAEVLDELRKVVPQAERTAPEVRSRGRTDPPGIDAFMSQVLDNIEAYWARTFSESGLPAPSVRAVFVPPGGRVATACGAEADDRSAFYCPADDTIYVAQVFASELYEGVIEGLPGQEAGFGQAAGDFAVAYVLAHEYAHNLQQELGIFDNAVTPKARPYELHADCWSGSWGNAVYEQGLLEAGDLEEALDTALAIGDFDFGNAQHHGTPEERREALLTGYRTGDPSACSRYLSPS